MKNPRGSATGVLLPSLHLLSCRKRRHRTCISPPGPLSNATVLQTMIETLLKFPVKSDIEKWYQDQ